MATQLFSLTDVWGGYDGRAVLREVSLHINSDDFIGIIGPNGGGKTTLMRLLLGEIKPMAGQIERNCPTIGYLPRHSRLIGNFPSPC